VGSEGGERLGGEADSKPLGGGWVEAALPQECPSGLGIRRTELRDEEVCCRLVCGEDSGTVAVF